MKQCVGIICLLFFFIAGAQRPKADFAAIDWHVQSVEASSLDSLAVRLTAPYTTDLEKTRAIYSWICQNIRYNVDIFRPRHLRARYIPEPTDTTAEWKSGDEMFAEKVFRRGVAVCEGYARLFKVLCQYAGVDAVVLNGYVRSNLDRSAERFRTNHTWNAVRIDSTWHLVDATWGAGYVTYADEFVQQQNDYYFLTPPQEMIRDHYPEDLRWTLLTEPPTLAEFRRMPFKSKSFLRYGIQSYAPSHGLLDADVGDTLSFSISLYDVKRSKSMSSDPFADSAILTSSPLSTFLKPEKEAGEKVYYSFVVDASTQWVHLLFNDDVILRYHINRRRSLARN